MKQQYALNKSKYLLTPEREKLEEICTHFIRTDRRNCLLILLALKTGARASEILNLKRSDIDPYEQSLFIKGIKGSNDRELPIQQKLFFQLQTHAEQTKTEKIFSISYPRLVQIWLHYRPVHKKFHSLRHTFAIELYKKTKDLRLVQFALGHRNISNTMIYADYLYSQEELRKHLL